MFRMCLYRVLYRLRSDGPDAEWKRSKNLTMKDYARAWVKENVGPEHEYKVQVTDSGNPWEDVRYL